MKKYLKEDVAAAVAKSTCWRQVLECLNPHSKGHVGGQDNIKKTAVRFGIDYSHFPGQTWNAGKLFGPKRKIWDYFNGAPIGSNNLKKRLIRDGYKKDCCECCQKTKWLDVKIPLELHHKDGDRKNNKLENLEVLCPNCHYYRHEKQRQEKRMLAAVSITPMKIKARVAGTSKQPVKKKRNNECAACKKPAVGKYCSRKCCTEASRRAARPTQEELAALVWQKPCVKITKDLGLKSSTTIAKWCRIYGIQKPPRGYWEKIFHGPVTGTNTSTA